MPEQGKCPIWGTPAEWLDAGGKDGICVDSPRAGGRYFITGTAVAVVAECDSSAKARLTTWLVDQRNLGVECPCVTPDIINRTKNQKPLTPQQRLDKLLQLIQTDTNFIGKIIDLGFHRDIPLYLVALAFSESFIADEIRFLVRTLIENKLIDGQLSENGISVWLKEKGYARLAELESKAVDSSQAFVAMWFDGSMDTIYEQGIAPGIEDAGYKPFLISQKEHNDSITDQIIAEIRRSRFLVADFTCGDDGARGGVYYEAGFAKGLGLEVIFTCRKDLEKKIHFDTRQFNHIFWETPADLRKALKDRIGATIGDGPLHRGKDLGQLPR